jgi:hypothetical protein
MSLETGVPLRLLDGVRVRGAGQDRRGKCSGRGRVGPSFGGQVWRQKLTCQHSEGDGNGLFFQQSKRECDIEDALCFCAVVVSWHTTIAEESTFGCSHRRPWVRFPLPKKSIAQS